MNKFIIFIFLILSIISQAKEEVNDIKRIKEIFKKESIEVNQIMKKENKKTYLYYKIIKSDKSENYIIFSKKIYTEKEGMNGKVPLIIVTDIKFKILDIIMEENRETAVQVERIKKMKYLVKIKKYLNGESDKIDSVSGATYTSRALLNGSIESIERVKKLELIK